MFDTLHYYANYDKSVFIQAAVAPGLIVCRNLTTPPLLFVPTDLADMGHFRIFYLPLTRMLSAAARAHYHISCAKRHLFIFILFFILIVVN